MKPARAGQPRQQRDHPADARSQRGAPVAERRLAGMQARRSAPRAMHRLTCSAGQQDSGGLVLFGLSRGVTIGRHGGVLERLDARLGAA
jgi:hypothetical protein